MAMKNRDITRTYSRAQFVAKYRRLLLGFIDVGLCSTPAADGLGGPPHSGLP